MLRRYFSVGLLIVELLFATLFIAACAVKSLAISTNDVKHESLVVAPISYWSGRISLQVESEPPQSFFASFELSGQTSSGELKLISPLGTILGIMRWSQTGALLEQGANQQPFASADELLAKITGAAVPLPALFDWLAGKNTATPGWEADLARQADGRITAKRTLPSPQASLRIVLDK